MMTDKLFSSIRAFKDKTWIKKPKSCLRCDQPVTKEIVYSIGNEMSVIERYCSKCAEEVVQAHERSSA
jgi:predicted amidophosphoribosyltransferase